MNIVHVCLAGFYGEGLGYQENLISKYHALAGNNVSVLTTYFENRNLGLKEYADKESYTNVYGVKVVRIQKKKNKILPERFFWGGFEKVEETIEALNPDILFVHGGQFVSLNDVVHFRKKHPNVKLYIDQHGDYYNTPVDTFKQKIFAFYFGHFIRKAIKYTEKFYGVTPWRCDYLHNVYKVPQSKIELLVMGGDDESIDFTHKSEIRSRIRNELGVKSDDFLVVTGGKIDKPKNIHLLMQAVKNLNLDNLKLAVFGNAAFDIKDVTEELFNDDHIVNIGWLESSKVYDYFLASDLVFFPGTHSVLWEQAVACKVPCVFKDWEGMHHLDIGGNCEFFCDANEENIRKLLYKIVNNDEVYAKMKENAEKEEANRFLYSDIARRAIGD